MRSESPVLDLIGSHFWIVAIVAVLALAPIANTRLRNWIWAAVNAGAIAFLFGVDALALGLAVTLAVWSAAWAIDRTASKKAMFVASLAAMVVVFLFHKVNLPQVAFLGPARPLLAALGFSYVALRAIELLRAVYDERHPCPSLLSAMNYLLPFHMIAAGPIQAYDEFADQPVAPSLNRRGALDAVDRITLGLFKKFVIARVLKNVFLTGFTAHPAYTFLEIQVFYIWVFLDFSGYTDIAVGLGRLMGVRTPENFHRPLSARNITVYWERWHMSLSLFIRHNVFTPVQLGLVRRFPHVSPLLSASVAFTVAFVLVGLWHGVSLRWLVYGVVHALALIVCNVYRHVLRSRVGAKGVKRYHDNRPIRWLATAITFEYVAFSVAFALNPGRYWWE